MGNKKNKLNTNKHQGKFMGSKPPCRWKKQTTVTPESSTGLNGSRIINLHSLAKFIEIVASSPTTQVKKATVWGSQQESVHKVLIHMA